MLTVRHRRIRRKIEAYVDGELGSTRIVADVEQHLDACWNCTGEADRLRLIKSSLRTIGTRRPADLSVVRLRGWVEATFR